MNVGIKRCRGRGFTLVEILVVIVIVGILLAMSLGLHGRVKSKQIESRLLTEMAAIELALEGYKAKNGQYPASDPWSVNYPSVKWVPGLIIRKIRSTGTCAKMKASRFWPMFRIVRFIKTHRESKRMH